MPPKKWVPFHDPCERWCNFSGRIHPYAAEIFWGPWSWTAPWTSPHADLAWSTMMSTSKHRRDPPRPISHFVSKDIPSQWKCSQREAKNCHVLTWNWSWITGFGGDLASFMVRFLAQLSYLQRIQTYETLFGVGLSSPKPVSTHLVQTRYQWSTPTVSFLQPISSKKDPKEGIGGVRTFWCSEITWTSFCRWSHPKPYMSQVPKCVSGFPLKSQNGNPFSRGGSSKSHWCEIFIGKNPRSPFPQLRTPRRL